MIRKWKRVWPYAGVAIVAAVALSHVLLLAFIIAHRITFPLDLEWMEGGMLCHALQVVRGRPIYGPPSADFISFLYTPFYPVVVGLIGKVIGLSYLLGRVVSVAAFAGACALAFLAVRRHAGTTAMGVLGGTVTVGLICSAFPHTGAWFDLVRNDSLYLFLTVSALYLLLYYHQQWRWVGLAGLCMGLAFLTKQTASVFVLASGLALLLLNWRMLWLYVPVVGLVAGGSVWVWNQLTEGWFWRYVFELHQQHDFYWHRLWPKTEVELFQAFPAVTMLMGAWILTVLLQMARGRRLTRLDRESVYWLGFALVGVAVAALGFATQWAEKNAYIPAFFFGALFAGVASTDLMRHIGGMRAGVTRRPALAGVVGALVGGGLAWQLATQLYQPSPHVPDARSRAAADVLLRRVAAYDGPVLIPYHPFYPYLVGKDTSYHRMGINDITRAGMPRPPAVAQRIRDGYYSAVFFDTPPWREPGLLRSYKFERYLPPEESPAVVTGFRTRPRYELVPKVFVPAPEGTRRVFDFEDGTYRGWKIEGVAFGSRPAGGPLDNQRMAGPFEGRYLASSQVRGVSAVGRLLSPEFRVEGEELRFRVGGGRSPKQLQVNLLVDGRRVHSATGTGNHIMREVSVDVSGYVGKSMRVELVDRRRGREGYLLFDDLRVVKR